MIKKQAFFFMRHGQTDWNRAGRIMGSTDIALNDSGKLQAKQIIELVRSANPSKIISSPLLRAYETACIISNAINCELEIHNQLQECNWGVAEGMVSKGSPVDLYLKRRIQPENSEPIKEFQQRVCQAINEIISSNELPLIIAHGGVYWAIMELIDCDGDDIDNALLLHFVPDGNNKWEIINIK